MELLVMELEQQLQARPPKCQSFTKAFLMSMKRYQVIREMQYVG